MAAAGSLAVTFHRAFDMCADPYQAYRTLADSGVARILTSGQQASAEKGLSLITELIATGILQPLWLVQVFERPTRRSFFRLA